MRGEGRGQREDLHARVTASDYEHFALEIGESVRMESHAWTEMLELM